MNQSAEMVQELRTALSGMIQQERKSRGLSQLELSKLLKTKQPQIVRLETGEKCSVEAQLRALFSMGVTPVEIAATIAAIKPNDTY